MQVINLAGLVKITLPTREVLLTDGGFLKWGADIYRSKDATFGAIGSVDGLQEGQGNEIPALDLDLLPPGDAVIGDLSKPGYQQSRVQFWFAEFDVATGEMTGTPELFYDGQIDQTSLRVGKTRTLSMSIVSNAERLFELDIGNSMSPTFHKSIHPGEKGHDNAAGLKIQVAWGTDSVSTAGGGGGGGGRGGGGGGTRERQQY